MISGLSNGYELGIISSDSLLQVWRARYEGDNNRNQQDDITPSYHHTAHNTEYNLTITTGTEEADWLFPQP